MHFLLCHELPSAQLETMQWS